MIPDWLELVSDFSGINKEMTSAGTPFAMVTKIPRLILFTAEPLSSMSSPQTRKRKSRLDAPRDAIIDSAKRQLSEAGAVAADAITSGAWSYPVLVRDLARTLTMVLTLLRGCSTCFPVRLEYLIELTGLTILPDPSVMKPIIPALFRGTLMALAVVAALFFFTYLPQVAVLAFVSGPLGDQSPLYILELADREPSIRRCDPSDLGRELCSGQLPVTERHLWPDRHRSVRHGIPFPYSTLRF